MQNFQLQPSPSTLHLPCPTLGLVPWAAAPWDVSESLQEVLQPQLPPLIPHAETGLLKGAKEDMR